MNKATALYILSNSYFYEGCYQSLPRLPGKYLGTELEWTILGAALVDMIIHRQFRTIEVHIQPQIVNEWSTSAYSTRIVGKIHAAIKDLIKRNFATVNLIPAGNDVLMSKIKALKG